MKASQIPGYRNAVKGDVTCLNCANSADTTTKGGLRKRIHCTRYTGQIAVGFKKTCDLGEFPDETN